MPAVSPGTLAHTMNNEYYPTEEAFLYALSGIPPEQVRHHICWGNYEGPHHRDVELKDIVDILLKSRVGAMYVERANRTSSSLRVWCSCTA